MNLGAFELGNLQVHAGSHADLEESLQGIIQVPLDVHVDVVRCCKPHAGSVKTGCIAKKRLSSRTFWWGLSVTRSGGFSYI